MSNRVKFFLSHLSISIIIILFASLMIFFLWYPSSLATALGVTHLFLMLLIIDIIVGPLLGLFVYKEGKKTLKFDLGIVVILQICAFSYGLYMLEQGRPAWIVFDSLNFTVVKKSDIEAINIHQSKVEYQQPSWSAPTFVATQFFLEPVARKFFNSNITRQTNSVIRSPIYYTNLANAKIKIQFSSLPLSSLELYNDKNNVAEIVQSYPDANAWIGLSAPVKDMVVLINKEKAEVVKIVDLRPWH